MEDLSRQSFWRTGFGAMRRRSQVLPLLLCCILLFASLPAPALGARTATPLTVPRIGLVGAGGGQFAFFTGGYNGSDPTAVPNYQTAFEIYDGTTLSRVTAGNLSYGRYLHAVGGTFDNATNTAYFVVVGGMPAGGPAQSKYEVVSITATSNALTLSAPLAAPSGLQASEISCAGAVDDAGIGYVICGGGVLSTGQVSSQVQWWQTSSQAWLDISTLQVPRRGAACAARGNVFVMSGGVDANGALPSGLEVFVRLGISTWSRVVFPDLARLAGTIGILAPFRSSPDSVTVAVCGGYSDINGTALTFNGLALYTVNTSAATVGLNRLVVTSLRARSAGGCGSRSCLFFGGVTSNSVIWNSVDTYNPFGDPTLTSFADVALVDAATAITSDDVIFVAGGKSDIGQPSTMVTAYGALPHVTQAQLSSPATHVAAAASGNLVFFVGGCTTFLSPTTPCTTSRGNIDMFDVSSGSMLASPISLRQPRYQASALTSANGLLVVAGGRNRSSVLNSIELFDVLTLSTLPSRTLGQARYGMAAAAFGNTLVFSGGFSDLSLASNKVEVFLLLNQTSWLAPAGTLIKSRALHAMAYLASTDQMLSWGGYADTLSTPLSSAEAFNVSTLSFASSAQLLPSIGGMVGVSIADNLAFFGGGSDQPASAALQNSLQWSAFARSDVPTQLGLGELYTPAVYAAGASDPSAAVQVGVIAGGMYSSTQSAASAVAIDTINVCDNGHIALAHLKEARYHHAAAAAGGYVVIGGGQTGSTVLDTVEVFSIASRPPTPSPSPTAPGSITSAPPQTGCVGTRPVATATCVGGVWTVPPGVTTTPIVTIDRGQTLTIDGTLVLLPNANTTVAYPAAGVPITVLGSISVNGSLTITIAVSIADGTIIPIIGGPGVIEGGFDSVTVKGRKCQTLTGQTVPTSDGGLGVLVSVESDSCTSGLSKGAIAGIVVGAVIFVALVVLAILYVLYRHSPSNSIFNKRSNKDEFIR